VREPGEVRGHQDVGRVLVAAVEVDAPPDVQDGRRLVDPLLDARPGLWLEGAEKARGDRRTTIGSARIPRGEA
jgi:hypothetical protein